MKRDAGIILSVVLAVVLGGLAGALTGRAGGDDNGDSPGSAGRLGEISSRLQRIEQRLEALESSKLKFENETEVESKISALVDRLSRLEQKVAGTSKTPLKPRLGPARIKPYASGKNQVAPGVEIKLGAERRKEVIEKQYESRNKYLDRQIEAVDNLARRSNVALSDSQKSSLKETLFDSLNRKKEFDISCIDDPDRAKERAEEYKRIEEDEDNAVKALLDDEQYKAYSRYFKRGGGMPRPRRRGRRGR